MNYTEAKQKADELYEAVKVASDVLNTFPKGPMGLTPDSVKSSKEFKYAVSAYELASYRSRTFNQQYTKNFKKERAAERVARFSTTI